MSQSIMNPTPTFIHLQLGRLFAHHIALNWIGRKEWRRITISSSSSSYLSILSILLTTMTTSSDLPTGSFLPSCDHLLFASNGVQLSCINAQMLSSFLPNRLFGVQAYISNPRRRITAPATKPGGRDDGTPIYGNGNVNMYTVIGTAIIS